MVPIRRDRFIIMAAVKGPGFGVGGVFHAALSMSPSQMFLSAKQREEEHQEMLIRQANLQEMLRRAREREEKSKAESITDQEMVDSFFGFLPLLGQEEPVAGGYEVRFPVLRS